MQELKQKYSILIVTHNMQQAARISDHTAFFTVTGSGEPGRLVEYGPTATIFSNPSVSATADYLAGRFG
jgi:phosphate transport system ATP-binding protein